MRGAGTKSKSNKQYQLEKKKIQLNLTFPRTRSL